MQDIFHAMSSPVRRKILATLAVTDLEAREIAAQLEMPKSNVVQQLLVLEKAGLVRAERSGPKIQYRIIRARLISAFDSCLRQVGAASRALISGIVGLMLSDHVPHMAI